MLRYGNRILALIYLGFMVGNLMSTVGQVLTASTFTWWDALSGFIFLCAVLVIGYFAGKESGEDYKDDSNNY